MVLKPIIHDIPTYQHKNRYKSIWMEKNVHLNHQTPPFVNIPFLSMQKFPKLQQKKLHFKFAWNWTLQPVNFVHFAVITAIAYRKKCFRFVKRKKNVSSFVQKCAVPRLCYLNICKKHRFPNSKSSLKKTTEQ